MSKYTQKQPVSPDEMTAAEYLRELATGAYMLAVFLAVPLLVQDRYSQIGIFKYRVFRLVSLAGLALVFVTHLSVVWSNRAERVGKDKTPWKRRLSAYLREQMSLPDWLIAGYGLCVLLSWLFAADRAEALWGARGWYMGLASQMIFVASYFVVSRFWSGEKHVWYAACGAAFFLLLLGAACRFSVDPFGMYEGLPENTIRQYLSLLGQNTWYSSYMCTVFPLGLFLFWGADREAGAAAGKTPWLRIGGGLFCLVGFSSWVTQNSDSAYVALALIVLALFVYGFTGNFWMERFFQVVLLMLLAFIGTGFLQDLFPERAILPEALSLFFSKSIVTIVSFIAVCVFYGLFLLWQRRGGRVERLRWIGRAATVLFAVAVAAAVLLIVANTKGYLETWFHVTLQSNYLLFDENWGNGRGRTWQFSVRLFRELPLGRKLLGVGPDCFAAYSYADPVYKEALERMWPGNTLTNAHCEWLTSLICYGLAGALCYIGIFVTAIVRFFRAGRRHPVLIAAALSALAYAGHNTFCYQQVLCTPFLFLILGMGERLLRLSEDS